MTIEISKHTPDTPDVTPEEAEVICKWFQQAGKILDDDTGFKIYKFIKSKGGKIDFTWINAAVRSVDLQGLKFYPLESPANWREICSDWIKNRAPKGILNRAGTGLEADLAGRVATMMLEDFQNVYSLDNIDAVLRKLTSQPVVSIAPKKIRREAQQALYDAGVQANTGRVNHARKEEKASIVDVVKEDLRSQQKRHEFRAELAKAETYRVQNWAQTFRERKRLKDELKIKYPQFASEIQ